MNTADDELGVLQKVEHSSGKVFENEVHSLVQEFIHKLRGFFGETEGLFIAAQVIKVQRKGYVVADYKFDLFKLSEMYRITALFQE